MSNVRVGNAQVHKRWFACYDLHHESFTATIVRFNLTPWRFGDSWRSSHGVPQTRLPEQQTEVNSNVEPATLLELIRWHIDRYDRIRASTSTRASILLSANSILLAGVALLANFYTREAGKESPLYVTIIFLGMTTVTLVLILTSVLNCISAIAARKTVRALHPDEIPSRFLFNWGDTLRSVDGYSDFVNKITTQSTVAMIGFATAELWTDIVQHRRRHHYLRVGVSVFRYCAASFGLLCITTITATVMH